MQKGTAEQGEAENGGDRSTPGGCKCPPQPLLLTGNSKSILSPPSLRLPPPEPDGMGATEARARAFRNYYYYYYYYYYYSILLTLCKIRIEINTTI